MITEEMLRRAAVISSDAFVRNLEDYDREEHVFSPKFEKKIRKLYRRANHPYLYRAMKKVASFLLALLIGGGVWLTVDKEARAAFFGWIKEVYEYAVWYSFGGSKDESIEQKEYYIPVLPEGYEKAFEEENDGGRIKVYMNEERQFLQFHYRFAADITGLGTSGDTVKAIESTVNGHPADILIFEDSTIANVIVWKTENDAVFAIFGFLSPEELIALAESVKEVP